MGTVADFIYLYQSSFSLKMGNCTEQVLETKLLDALAPASNILLSWNQRIEISNGQAIYTVRVNQNSIGINNYQVTNSDWSTIQINLSTALINPANNRIEFQVTGGKSTLLISNVILWYQKLI